MAAVRQCSTCHNTRHVALFNGTQSTCSACLTKRKRKREEQKREMYCGATGDTSTNTLGEILQGGDSVVRVVSQLAAGGVSPDAIPQVLCAASEAGGQPQLQPPLQGEGGPGQRGGTFRTQSIDDDVEDDITSWIFFEEMFVKEEPEDQPKQPGKNSRLRVIIPSASGSPKHPHGNNTLCQRGVRSAIGEGCIQLMRLSVPGEQQMVQRQLVQTSQQPAHEASTEGVRHCKSCNQLRPASLFKEGPRTKSCDSCVLRNKCRTNNSRVQQSLRTELIASLRLNCDKLMAENESLKLSNALHLAQLGFLPNLFAQSSATPISSTSGEQSLGATTEVEGSKRAMVTSKCASGDGERRVLLEPPAGEHRQCTTCHTQKPPQAYDDKKATCRVCLAKSKARRLKAHEDELKQMAEIMTLVEKQKCLSTENQILQGENRAFHSYICHGKDTAPIVKYIHI